MSYILIKVGIMSNEIFLGVFGKLKNRFIGTNFHISIGFGISTDFGIYIDFHISIDFCIVPIFA
jgi:hypothetical protein